MLVSGSVGYTLFEKNSKSVLVLADVHDGVSYCESASMQISDYLKQNFDKKQIIVEETIPEQLLGDKADALKLQDLWPNSLHTQELKKLAFSNKEKLKAVDFRPILVPFSWELIKENKQMGNIKFSDYIKFIDAFFKKKSHLFNGIILKELNKLNNKFISKINSTSYHLFVPLLLYFLYKIGDSKDVDPEEVKRSEIEKTKIIDHINEVHEMFIYLKADNKRELDLPLSYFIENKVETLHQVNYILSLIMEWYMILLISNNNKDSIVHTGLAHSSNLVILLEKYYSFKKVSEYGVNNVSNFDEKNMPVACIELPSNVTNKFSKKNFGLVL